MPNFIFAYHGGKAPESEEEGAKVMQQWMAWFGSLGDAVVNAGNPVGPSKTVTAQSVINDGGANPVSGFSIVSASDIDAAVEMVKSCPMVMDGSGSAEVAELFDM